MIMLNKLKKCRAALMFVLILFMCGTAGLAAAQSRLIDGAGLLEDEEFNSVLSDLDSLSDEYNCEVVIFTEDTEVYDIQDRADLLLESYGKNGILLYINMYARDWAVSTYGECIDIFTDQRLDVLCGDVINKLQNGDNAGACRAFISNCQYYLGVATGGQNYDSYDNYDNYSSYSSYGSYDDEKNIPQMILISLGIGLIIALIIDLVWVFKLKPVKAAFSANNYAHDMNIKSGGERFVRSSVSKTRIQSSSSSGGSTTHRSSSGGTHGGRSGKF